MATITQIRYAVAIDRHRSFRAAAKWCHVTQPTLSAGLKKLEEHLEILLFDRSRSPVEPTPEGTVLLEQFQVVLREHERIHDVVSSLRGMVRGPYQLGIIPTMAPYMLPRFLPAFGDEYPDVTLHIEELPTDQIVTRLTDGTLDAGILAGPLADRRVVEFELGSEEFCVFHSPTAELPLDADGRVDMSRLPTERLLVLREEHCLRAQTLHICRNEVALPSSQRFAIEAGSVATLCAMVLQGPFFTVLPALAADDLRSAGQGHLLKDIAGPVPYREVTLVVHRSETKRAIRDALIGCAKDALPSLRSTKRAKQPTAPH